MRRLIKIERELRYMKEVQDRLTTENTELKFRLVECEVSAIKQGLKGRYKK
ncbi:hypothetical protein E2C01_072945 [Portunus trituberculatus]|uniref:Uncharacterized protein n=1 Tax=Portunus trituberculatus TaxID=210409 RepID=A0A5B7I995_PORTR|nr:hypothetical protein [Portunus trituberculatus]